MMIGCSGFFSGCLYLCACWNLKGPTKTYRTTYNNNQGPLSCETVCLDANSVVIIQENNNIHDYNNSSNCMKLQLLQQEKVTELRSNELESKLYQELYCNNNCNNLLQLQV